MVSLVIKTFFFLTGILFSGSSNIQVLFHQDEKKRRENTLYKCYRHICTTQGKINPKYV